jgi:hypothetical protein
MQMTNRIGARLQPLFVSYGAIAIALASTLAVSAVARAEETTIKDPGQHPSYPIEIEPHAVLGMGDIYGSTGAGVGLRLSIPIVQNGFVKSIDDSVAISFGGDFLHYSNCYYAERCGANYLLLPVALQWNFFLTRHWSVFGEPGLYVYKGFMDSCGNLAPCQQPSDFGIGPAFAIGGRYQFNETVTLAMRLGYPSSSIGVSFL